MDLPNKVRLMGKTPEQSDGNARLIAHVEQGEHMIAGGRLIPTLDEVVGGNGSMKAITLWQPWASLVALGVKTIETRSWATSYRGPLAIHAAQQKITEQAKLGVWDAYPADPPNKAHPNYNGPRPARMYRNDVGLLASGQWMPLSFGAVVATCTLTDVIPMVDRWHSGQLIEPMKACLIVEPCHLLIFTPGATPVWTEMEHERPYGDFSPGRWAWLLEDIEPLDEPILARGNQRLWDWSPAHSGR